MVAATGLKREHIYVTLTHSPHLSVTTPSGTESTRYLATCMLARYTGGSVEGRE